MVYSPVWAQIQRRPRPFNWNTAISRGHKSHRQPGYEGKLFRCMGYPGGGGWGVRPGSTCHATVWGRGSGSRGGIWAGGDRSDPPGAGRPPDEVHISTSSQSSAEQTLEQKVLVLVPKHQTRHRHQTPSGSTWWIQRHSILTLCWFNAGLASQTLAQRWTNTDPMSCICWEEAQQHWIIPSLNKLQNTDHRVPTLA